MKSRKILLSIVVILAITALIAGWTAWNRRQAALEIEARKALESVGVLVTLSSDRRHVQGIAVLPSAEQDIDQTMRLAAQLPHLEVLRLARSDVTDGQLTHIAGSYSLTMLGLGHTSIGDEGLQHLTDLQNLRALYLASTNVSSKGIGSISELRGLEILDLSNTDTSGSDFASLVKLDRLKHLLLSGVPLSENAMDAFAELGQISRLTIQGCGVSDEAVEKLKQAKPRLHVDQ